AGSGNQTLASMLAGINSHTLHARVWHGTLDADANRRAHEEHEAIYAAVRDRDPVLAHSAALIHVANTERWYREMPEQADRPSDEYVLSTKVGRLLERNPRPTGSDLDVGGFAVPDDVVRRLDYTADGVRRSLEESLARLDLDRVDVLYVHDPDDPDDL